MGGSSVVSGGGSRGVDVGETSKLSISVSIGSFVGSSIVNK